MKTASQRSKDQSQAADMIALHPADHLPDAGSSIRQLAKPRQRTALAPKASPSTGKLKKLGGSKSDTFNTAVLRSAVDASWFATTDERDKVIAVTVAALEGVAPRDELEGMLAAQMIAAHRASMECYRRAMIEDQPSHLRDSNLNQAAKASRTYAALVEALNRHRGKGQQKVTVEHVHVHEGGQAIVGAVESGDRGETEYARLPHE